MSGLKLYEISDDLDALLQNGIDQETGEISQELAEHLAKFEDKGRAVVAFIMNQDATSEAIDSAIQKLSKKKSSIDRVAKSLREYLAFNMKRTGINSIDAIDGTFSAKLQLDRDESVEVFDELQIPEKFMVMPEVKAKPDKAEIKKVLKSGNDVPGARIAKKDRLTIK